MCEICPRLKRADMWQRIDAVNAGLATLCKDKGSTFVDNAPSFSLGDASINDGYLLPDGVHITTRAMDKIARNLKLAVKDAADGVCKDHAPKSTGPRAPRAINRSESGPEHRAPINKSERGSERRITPKKRDNETDWTTVRNKRSEAACRANFTDGQCFYCGEGGHVQTGCRHGRMVQCRTCNGIRYRYRHRLKLVLCLGWNVRLIAKVGQWVTNKIFSVHFLTVSVSFEEDNISKECNYKNLIGSVGHQQCYINWSSAPYPSYIQTFKRIR